MQRMEVEMDKERRYDKKCSVCGYIIPEELYYSAAFDFPCPRCRKCTLSYFVGTDILEDKEHKNE
jgi:predicted RNA-binding Zn-ribbon protein involved in translation (DUF1610 family)